MASLVALANARAAVGNAAFSRLVGNLCKLKFFNAQNG